jgi:hypothetical protein
MGQRGFRARRHVFLRLGTLSAAVLAVAAGAWTPAASAQGRTASPGVPGVVGKRGTGPAAANTNLVDHGGKIIPASHTYVIWWGAPAAWPSDVASGIPTLLQGLNGSGLLKIGGQYMRGVAIGSGYQGAKTDTSAPPRKVSPSTLGSEVAKEYGASLDSAGVYVVYTSNFPPGANFCAWHSFASVNGKQIAVAYMPNTTGVAGCDTGNPYRLSGSQGLRSLANVTSHEFMEAITDASPANGSYAWIDASGSEIGDKCAWQFAGPVTLSNGSVWQLQEEWSNTARACAQTG